MLAMRNISMASEQPTVSVNPSVISAGAGEFFTLDVTVADLTAENSQPVGLCGWQVNITFNHAILNISAVAEGPFLEQAGSTWWLPPVLDNENGFVVMAASLFPMPAQGAYGSGILANITFQVENEGQTDLNFDSETTYLRSWDANADPPQQVAVPHSAVGGAFGYTVLHDVAVTDVTFSPMSVSAGGTVSIDVTVRNKGNASETFDISVSYDSSLIETKTITALAPGTSQTIGFNWDTAGVAEGSYTITAVAATVPDETETTDNTFQSTDVVTITAPQPTLPIELIIGGIIVIVAVGVGAFFLMKRRSAKAESAIS